MFIFYSNIDLNLFCLQHSYTDGWKKRNVIKLVPMNPDVSLAEKDLLKRSLFRNDDKLLTKVQSEEFQEILRTDPTTEEGEAKVVNILRLLMNGQRLKKGETKRTHYRFCVKLLLSIDDC